MFSNIYTNFKRQFYLGQLLFSGLAAEDMERVTHSGTSSCCVTVLSMFSQSFRLETTDREIFQESELDVNYVLWRCLPITRVRSESPTSH